MRVSALDSGVSDGAGDFTRPEFTATPHPTARFAHAPAWSTGGTLRKEWVRRPFRTTPFDDFQHHSKVLV
jgi:hypothetical protein